MIYFDWMRMPTHLGNKKCVILKKEGGRKFELLLSVLSLRVV